METRRLEVWGEDDAARPERLEGELTRQALVSLDGVLYQDSACPRLEERVERQSPSSVGEGDDDAMGPGRSDDATEVLGAVYDADNGPSEIRPPLDLLDDLPRQGAPPEDQHALLGVTTAPDAMTQAQPEQEADDDEEARHERVPVELRLGDEAVDDAHRIHDGS